MLSPRKKKSIHRLSALFSLGGSKDADDSSSPNSSESGGRISKSKTRVSSAKHLSPEYPVPSLPQRTSTLTIQPVDSVSTPLEPPPPIPGLSPRSASPSGRSSIGSRPSTPTIDGSGRLTPGEGGMKKLRRKSKLFGGGSDSTEQVNEVPGQGPMAWIVGHRGKLPYNLAMLLNGERVEELWDESGDTFVYLFPRTSGKGPSFRIDSSAYAASGYMTRLVHGRLYSEGTAPPSHLPDRVLRSVSGGNYLPSRTASPDLTVPEGSSASDTSKGSRALSEATEDDHSETHLYLPIQLTPYNAPASPGFQEAPLKPADVDTLVSYRNFFAFLVGQSLVATERSPGIFEIFMKISDVLQNYQFSNVDGSTYGEVAASSFDSYVDELNIADVRTSREKTVEAIVLGERMRSVSLYTEGFVHGVGKFEELKALDHPKMAMISPKTITRMGRASLDLTNRQFTINNKLKDFAFETIFSGIMNSETADEGKLIKFKNWRIAFGNTRGFVHDYYRAKYGSWLPRARSKKNSFESNGLNRLVLLDIYHDLSNLYDLLVDRTNLTTRTADGFTTEDEGTDFESVARLALRKVLMEYDRSTPPVQPPVPFDLPLYPSLTGFKKDYPTGDAKKDAKARAKRLKSDEISSILKQSYNADSDIKTPFMIAFRQFEQKQAHGKSCAELIELRNGQWLFLYAVLQSLPMMIIDAPGVRFTEGVEYFLCEAPKSGMPWGREDTARARTWYGVGAGGQQVVSLPSHVVEFGIDAVYRRSHCWQMAEKWSQNDQLLSAAVQETMMDSPLPPPPMLLTPDGGGNRSRSPSRDSRRESVLNLGLEALPLPAGVSPMAPTPSRPSTANDPNKTFDDILGSSSLAPQGKKNKKKK